MRERERESTQEERQAEEKMNPCPICDARLHARGMVAHLKAAHPADVDAAGDLLPSTIARLASERMTEQERERSRKREMLGQMIETAQEHGMIDETPETPPAPEPLSGDGDMAHRCETCGRVFKSGAALGGHRKVHNAQGGTPVMGEKRIVTTKADDVPSKTYIGDEPGAVQNIAVAIAALKDQATHYRTKAEKLDAMAEELGKEG